MVIKRWLEDQVIESLSDQRITIVYGARQVGKTTLVKKICEQFKGLYLSCTEPDIREAFTNKTSTEIKRFIGNAQLVILDEAQMVPNIGLSLKLMYDTFPQVKVIATGSSSFDLSNAVAEPLTGRNITFTLFPISYAEYADTIGAMEARRLLEERVIYGMYPAVVTASDPRSILAPIAHDYLLKDTFRIGLVRKPLVIERLVKLLALQSGSEVSYRELAQTLEVSSQTVMDYVRLLEQAFVVFRLPPLAKNPRNEITRFEKVFFYDTGIRNALIGNLNTLENRVDKGALFENFFVSERVKQYQQMSTPPAPHFWRTRTQSEVDLVEEYPEGLRAFECKWSRGSISTRAWNNAYPGVEVQMVTRDTIAEVLLKPLS